VIDAETVRRFATTAVAPDEEALTRAALLIPALEYEAFDPAPTLRALERLGAAAAARLGRVGAGAPAAARVEALNALFFAEEGFHGNEDRYDDPRNSFLNDVVARRTGIPISLSVVYIDVARRAGLHLEGVGFPGRFLVRHPPSPHERLARPLIIDPFDGGALLTEADCRQLLRQHLGDDAAFDRRLLAPADRVQILARMLTNLKRLYVSMRSFPQARDAVDLLLGLDPLSPTELRDRGLLSYHMQDLAAALRDLEACLKVATLPGGAQENATITDEERDEPARLWEHVKTLRRRLASFN
jgi:regulator of sirC expression with transglutaminase-like and TPR domain